MKKNICVFISLVALVGCQLPTEKRATGKAMNELLKAASERNRVIEKKDKETLPDNIKAALMPNLASNDARAQSTVSHEKRFNLVAEQVPARTFFLSLVQDTPYNITVHPDVEGKISLQLKKVTIPEVLATVRNVYGYDFHQTNQGIEVLPATLQTRAFSVNYLDIHRGGASETQVSAGTLKSSGSNTGSSSNNNTGSANASNTSDSNTSGGTENDNHINSKITTRSKADFWTELKATVETIVGGGEGRRVAISPLASLIVVQAMPAELKRVEEYLKSASLSLNRQVILEAKILEVELNDAFQAGINWNLISGRLGAASIGNNAIAQPLAFGGTFPPEATQGNTVNVVPGQAAGSLSAVASNAGSFGGVFALSTNFKHLGSFLELLGAQGKVHVLSNPRVSTMNNQKALLKVGSDKFYVTNVSTTTTATVGTQAASTTPNVTLDSFFSGIALDVTPHITEEDEVTLHIHPTISTVDDDTKSFTINGTQQSLPLAKSSIRESDSMVKARNGEMVIIGGLMQEQMSDLNAGVPVLKDLPLLGRIFKRTVQVAKKSELVILLRPSIVQKTVNSEVIEDTFDRFNEINQELIKDENRYNCKGPHC